MGAPGRRPRRRPSQSPAGRLALAALGLLAAFVAWTALSLTWTESVEQTSADLARVATYLGVFALALFARDRAGARRVVAAVGAGIVLVAAVALLSRLHPAWFPAADQTAQFLTTDRERLSYPLHYWNGLAALVAIGLPLVFQVATRAGRTPVARRRCGGAAGAGADRLPHPLAGRHRRRRPRPRGVHRADAGPPLDASHPAALEPRWRGPDPRGGSPRRPSARARQRHRRTPGRRAAAHRAGRLRRGWRPAGRARARRAEPAPAGLDANLAPPGRWSAWPRRCWSR